jgi:hypothetical protein
MPVAVGHLMLEIPKPMAVPGRLRRMLMLERFLQPMPVVCVTSGPLGLVSHDDVSVTVRVFAMCPVRVLDHFDKPVDMRIRTKIVAVKVLVIVPVRHRPMLQGDARCGQAAAGQ